MSTLCFGPALGARVSLQQPRVLLFWPVDGSVRTQDLVQRNVAYAKSFLHCEVFLAHYQANSEYRLQVQIDAGGLSRAGDSLGREI